jgi:hydroxymethylpyrimidine pyrophosphatase-like HAD family hydrolase
VDKILFIDLDDTLFQSLAKCPPEAELSETAYLADGRPYSFMTGKQRALWRWFDEQLRVIPVTARSGDAFRRVKLPFRDWAVLDFGGVILQADGAPDAEWLELSRALAADYRETLQELRAAATAFADERGLAVRIRIGEDYGVPFYWMAKYREGRAEDLDILQREFVAPWLEERKGAFYPHRNGNNLAVLPACLGKEHAVRHLIRRLRVQGDDILTLGMGDSLSDAAFMAECDYALTPRGSQLFDFGLAPCAAWVFA